MASAIERMRREPLLGAKPRWSEHSSRCSNRKSVFRIWMIIMKFLNCVFSAIFACVLLLSVRAAILPKYGADVKYEPTWESLDTRPLPEWYDDVKVGIFVHWGVYSAIGYGTEWVWYFWRNHSEPDIVDYFKKNFPPDITYGDFARDLRATFYNPDDWADLFEASGAKYVVFTSKHHEGYTMWPSNYSYNWNSMDVGPKRDIVGELAKSVRTRTKMHFGLYHSLLEWFHPLYLRDMNNNWQTTEFVEQKMMPALKEIINTYKPELIWSDGEWEAPDTYFNSTGFLSWLYNESPVKDYVVVNDRWGDNVRCEHGDYLTCMDRYNPGAVQVRKWEDAFTLDNSSWGFRRNMTIDEVLSIEEVIQIVAETVSCGGNILVNVGPTPDGIIPPIFAERLLQMGRWLKLNGEAIYETNPWAYQNDTADGEVWYTAKNTSDGDTIVYAMVLRWYDNNTVFLGAPDPSDDTKITLIGFDGDLEWEKSDGGIEIDLPPLQDVPSVEAWGYVLRLTKLKNPPTPKRRVMAPQRRGLHSFRRNFMK